MKKYHSEKDPFRDRTIIYDEHGKKVGYSEKAIFGDHVNVYDSKGNKVARQEKSFFGDHINVYDAKGKKTGEQHQALFGNHTNVYDAKGNKVGESQPSFWGSGTDYYSRESAASLPSAAIDPSNSWNFENRSAPPANTTFSPARYSVVNFQLESHSLRFREVIKIKKQETPFGIPPVKNPCVLLPTAALSASGYRVEVRLLPLSLQAQAPLYLFCLTLYTQFYKITMCFSKR